ncbi:rhodanese-like domain-containing protein [candidate division KSB1 bacterium]|nr:rhodanese-like domain-containing protein [candidate division KSB1 bacterium]
MKFFPLKAIYQALCMLMLATIIGIGVNYFHPKKAAFSLHRPPIKTVPDTMLAQPLPNVSIANQSETNLTDFDPLTFTPKIVDVHQVKKLLKLKQAILVDARSPAKYNHETIPDAINLPVEELYDYEEDIQKLSKKEWLICFCDDVTCDLGEMLAMELANHGFQQILYYKGGLQDWKDTGNKTTGGGQ